MRISARVPLFVVLLILAQAAPRLGTHAQGYTESTPATKARFMSPLHLLAAALFCMLSLTGQAATRFTHISPESERDPRTTYDRELLRLALDKTRD